MDRMGTVVGVGARYSSRCGVFALLVLGGCYDSFGSARTDTLDTSPPVDTSAGEPLPADTSPPDATTTVCNMTGISGVTFMKHLAESDFTEFGVQAGAGRLSLEFYDLGNGPSLTGLGVYQLNGGPGEDNYATCKVCGVIRTDTKKFLATAGTIDVTQLNKAGHTVAASLSNARFVEVTIDDVGETPTFESNPVTDGDVWCIPDLGISFEPQCMTNDACSAATPFCHPDTFKCVECRDWLDCTTDEPVCATFEDGRIDCIAGPAFCTGDDANEDRDDGPKGASPIALGTPIRARICDEQVAGGWVEYDWYVFTPTSQRNVEFELEWTGAQIDLDLRVLDSVLGEVQSGGTTADANPERVRAVNLPAGTYYVAVNSYAGAPIEAVAYTLRLATFTPDCVSDSGCTDTDKPVCDPLRFVCVPNP